MSVRGYALVVLTLVVALVAIEAARPRPLDLSVRLERTGDDPFDAEVFFESLPAWLGQPVESVGVTAFERLADSAATDRTYLFLAPIFAPDPAESERLLDFVERGGTVFVAAQTLASAFADSLGHVDSLAGAIGLRTRWPDEDVTLITEARDAVVPSGLGADTLQVVAPGARGVYPFPIDLQRRRLAGLDPARTEVLGTALDTTQATLVRVRHGAGRVLVSSVPLAFSNAALTGDGEAAAYVGAVLGALPDQPVWWDDPASARRAQAATPLRFVLTTPALRWAYVLLIVSGLLFLAFRGRRWQRPVPVIAPPPNAQREFARVLGRLHFTARRDRQLARRLAEGVLDRLRDDLRLAEPDLSDETARLAAARADVPEDEALDLFRALARAARRPSPDDLVALDGRIARFFRHV